MRLAFMLPPGNGPGLRYARCLGAALQKAGHEVALGGEHAPDGDLVLQGLTS